MTNRHPTELTPLPGPSAEQWNSLAAVAGNIFGTRAWNQSWWTHYGGRSSPLILVDDPQVPRVIVPLYISGRFLRQLRFIGSGSADQLGAVCAARHRSQAQELIRAGVLTHSRTKWDVLLLNDVLESDGWQAALGGHVMRRVASPSVQLHYSTWESYLMGKSSNFREQLRRRDRKVRNEFSADFRLATNETLTEDLKTLFRLHVSRWGPDAHFASGTERRLHEDFARTAEGEGWLRLWVLELDGRAVAALYGFRFAGTEYFYQSGRDPAFDKHSIGFVLLSHAIRTALEDGMAEYRLLRGDEAYKARFANAGNTLHTLAIANGAKGGAAIKAAAIRKSFVQ